MVSMLARDRKLVRNKSESRDDMRSEMSKHTYRDISVVVMSLKLIESHGQFGIFHEEINKL